MLDRQTGVSRWSSSRRSAIIDELSSCSKDYPIPVPVASSDFVTSASSFSAPPSSIVPRVSSSRRAIAARAKRRRDGSLLPQSVLPPSLLDDTVIRSACHALGRRAAVVWQCVVAALLRSDRALLAAPGESFASSWVESICISISARFPDVAPDRVRVLAVPLLARFLRPGPSALSRELPASFRR